MVSHSTRGPLVEEAGGRGAGAPPPPSEAEAEERWDWEDRISTQPWLSPELAPLVVEEEAEMVVEGGTCCKQLGGYCSWGHRVERLLPPVCGTGSGSAGEPACCI